MYTKIFQRAMFSVYQRYTRNHQIDFFAYRALFCYAEAIAARYARRFGERS